MNPSEESTMHYERIRKRLREETPTGMEVPRLTLVELIICEMLGEQQKEINNLKARQYLGDLSKVGKK